MTDPTKLRAEVREAAEGADPRPWKVCPMEMYIMLAGDYGMVADTGEFDDEAPPGMVARIRGTGRDAPQRANLHYIVAAANNALALCDALDAAERERDRLREAMDMVHALATDQLRMHRANGDALDVTGRIASIRALAATPPTEEPSP